MLLLYLDAVTELAKCTRYNHLEHAKGEKNGTFNIIEHFCCNRLDCYFLSFEAKLNVILETFTAPWTPEIYI